jgi:signal transduction histidine kinase/CheY-like chemotaxis protein
MLFSIFLLHLFCFASPPGNQQLVVIDGLAKTYNIRDQISVLKDLNNNYKLHEILEKDSDKPSQFKDSTKLNFGFTKAAYWYHFSLKNVTDTTQQLILNINYPDLNVVDFYQVKANKVLKSVFTGESRPFKAKDIRHRKLLFKIKIPRKEQHDFYVKVFNHGDTVSFPAQLQETFYFFEKDSQNSFLCSIYYGICLFIILLNGFLFFQLKESTYLYYGLYVLSLALFVLNMDGISYQLFWPNSPWWSTHSAGLFGAMSNLFLLLFGYHLLAIRTLHRFFYYSFYVLALLSIPMAVFSFISYYFLFISFMLLSICCVLTITLLIVISAFLSFKRHQPAYYFLLGFLFFLVFTTIFQLGNLGIIEANFYGIDIIKVGLFFEAIFLMYAVSYKFKRKEELNKVLKSFSGSIAHELRNPLANISVATSLFSSAINKKDNSQKNRKIALDATAIVNKNCKRAFMVIDMILKNIREEKINTDEFKTISIKEGLQATLKEYAFNSEIEKKKITLKTSPNFYFNGNKNLLMVVLFNVLKNSFYYLNMKPTGNISIWTEERVTTNSLQIKDNGPGIPKEKISTIFDSFMTSGKEDGTGLGLAFCKKVMESFGGSISCQSELNKWTTITLTFPKLAYTAQATTSHREVFKSKMTMYTPTILVAEDTPSNFELIQLLLKGYPFQLIWAKNGKEVLSICLSSEKKIALILMDIEMPVMGGVEALKALRKIPTHSKTPVIAITSNISNAAEGEAYIKKGFDHFIPKPFSKEVLVTSIQNYL